MFETNSVKVNTIRIIAWNNDFSRWGMKDGWGVGNDFTGKVSA